MPIGAPASWACWDGSPGLLQFFEQGPFPCYLVRLQPAQSNGRAPSFVGMVREPMRVCPRCAEETDHELCPHDGAQTFPVQVAQQTYSPGTVIGGRYQVEQVIGIGGFGAVYRCTQLNMQQTVAVKVLRNEHLTSLEHVKRFTREAQSVSRLKHPNTIHIFDFGSHSDGALYVAMEFLEGETLAHRLDQYGKIHWETMALIATQVCHSLTEAHAIGLVHRDLKPENIMLIPVAGDPNFVKVLDFGIAKMQKDPARPGEASLTEAGMIMGTPTYMAPEQAKGEEVDARSDIYALGVLMYESLTGHAPFQDETAMKVLVAHIKDPVPPFARFAAPGEVPFEIEQVVMQCLEKDPGMRPASTVQLVDRLVAAVRRARESAAAMAQVGDQPTTQNEALTTTAMAAMVSRRASSTDVPAEAVEDAAAGTRQGSAISGETRPGAKTPLLVAGAALVAVAAGVAVALALLGPNPRTKAASAAALKPAPALREGAPPSGPTAAPLAPRGVAEPAAGLAVKAAADPRPPVEVRPAAPIEPLTAPAAAAVPAAGAVKPELGRGDTAKAATGKPLAPKADAGAIPPTAAGPVKSEPAKSEPGKNEPDKTAPAKSEPGKPDAGSAEPAKLEPPKPEERKKPPGKDDFRLDD